MTTPERNGTTLPVRSAFADEYDARRMATAARVHNTCPYCGNILRRPTRSGACGQHCDLAEYEAEMARDTWTEPEL